jgi:hypothetical protein
MSEPKKETVRIVLPPRRDGQPLGSSSRETAMINLPPKPIQKPTAPETAPPAGGESSAMPPPPKPPGIPPVAPKAPSVAGLSNPPKPPSIPGVPAAPKPPSVVGVSPSVPKPPSFAAPPPLAPRAPATPSASATPAMARSPSVSGLPAIAPAPLAAESKKETAKVPPSTTASKSGLPQASVTLQRKPGASTSTPSGAAITVAPQAQPEGKVGLMLGVLAIAVSLLAVGVQVLMFL